ncbi:hypothetical protein [Burkholderia ubonensis]|uniref:TRAFAC clade GTPase domain-containing protein n=1 Tax=Burkholderia ubonensis TaxID=101571 RepID=UPI00075A5743|nr:hypothetical protein [Burkholderia ubonensis]KUZ74808.1 hypothetical protein WI37_20745 [Burkholderia ubonensis]
MSRSVVLLGGPDSGKTNYIGRVWPALDAKKGSLQIAHQPDDITFVLEVTDHLNSGNFAPRTDLADARRDFEVIVSEEKGGTETSIIIPDISGELWLNAVKHYEISTDWMDELRCADGALLFARVGSDQDVRPLDWVTSKRMMSKVRTPKDPGLPTQVMLCELIRFLEISLVNRPDGGRPRVSIVVSAWDLVDREKFAKGPKAWLEHEYPLLAGRLGDVKRLDIRVFGLSVVGGDLKTDKHCRDAVQEGGLDGRGWVSVQDAEGRWIRSEDLTLPIAWVIGA